MIPTFLGSTILVFTILQLAPGGPIEQIMLNLQMGGAFGEGSGGLDSDGGLSLPPKALLIVSIDARKISMQCFDGIDMLKFSMKPSIVVFVLLIPSLLPNVSLKYSVIVNVK